MIIADLRPGMVGIRLRAKVKAISPPRVVNTKFGTETKVAEATLSDESGETKLTLWAEQIDKVKPGDFVQIEDAMAKEWRGEIQLTVGKKGKMLINEDV